MIKDMDAAIKFDHDMVALTYTVQLEWPEQAREFASRCLEHGHSTEQLVGLVDALVALDPGCIFRIGRENSRVVYALVNEKQADVEIDTAARDCGCDEFNMYESNWYGRLMYRFWWD